MAARRKKPVTPTEKAKAKVQERPAETASLGLAGLIVLAFGLFDVNVTEAEAAGLIAGVGLVAPIVTGIVNRIRNS